MRTIPALWCLFGSVAVLGRTQVRGSAKNNAHRLLKVNPLAKKPEKKASVEPSHRKGPPPKVPPLQLDPMMLQLHPENEEGLDPDYMELLQNSDGHFGMMPPDMEAQELPILNQEIAEGRYDHHRSSKGGKGSGKGGGYKADYEYYPGPGESGKGRGKGSAKSTYYDDDYYYDDCPEEDDDYYYEEEEEVDESDEYIDDDHYYEMSYPGKGRGKGHGKGYGKGFGKGFGKGVGKGGSGKGEGKGSGKGRGSSKSGSGGKGKGKGGSGGSKGGSKGGKGCRTRTPHSPVHQPTHAPGSSKSGMSRPPADISTPPPIDGMTSPPAFTPTQSPSFPPVARPPSIFTASPTDPGSIAEPLDLYAIAYEVQPPDTPRQATRFELDEVEDLTRLYLEEFFFEEFEGSTFTFLDDFVTRMLTHTFMMGAPLIVNFESIARFSPFSNVRPSQAQLNTLLEIAFSDENLAEYESRLATRLSDGNVFKGTSAALVDATTRVSRSPPNDGPSGATIAAAAVAATLVAASVIIYRRRSREEEVVGKDLNDKAGDVTVAGETFAGDTYDGTASVSAASLEYANRQRYDEEAAARAFNLGTIAESDASSVRPLYEGDIMHDGDDDDDNEDDSHDDQAKNEAGSQDRVFATSSFGVDHSGHFFGKANSTKESKASDSTETDLDLSQAPSFEEIALQGPSCEPLRSLGAQTQHPVEDDDDETSQISESDTSRSSRSQHNAVATPEVQSLLTSETTEDRVPEAAKRSGSESPTERSQTSTDRQDDRRRPRTVAEIEALLSADLDGDDDDESIYTHLSALEDRSHTASRPRTVSEIESLLSKSTK